MLWTFEPLGGHRAPPPQGLQGLTNNNMIRVDSAVRYQRELTFDQGETQTEFSGLAPYLEKNLSISDGEVGINIQVNLTNVCFVLVPNFLLKHNTDKTYSCFFNSFTVAAQEVMNSTLLICCCRRCISTVYLGLSQPTGS